MTLCGTARRNRNNASEISPRRIATNSGRGFGGAVVIGSGLSAVTGRRKGDRMALIDAAYLVSSAGPPCIGTFAKPPLGPLKGVGNCVRRARPAWKRR